MRHESAHSLVFFLLACWWLSSGWALVLLADVLLALVLFAASEASRVGGRLVVSVVMGQMVGDRRSPGRQHWGASSCTSSAKHRISGPPTGSVHRDGWSIGQCTRWLVLHFLTGAALRRLPLDVAAQASGTSLYDLSATPDAEASRIIRRGAAARSTPLTRRGVAARSTPLTPSVVAGLSWPDRGHHVPALTATSGGRNVGFDVACLGMPGGFRTSYAGNSTRSF